MAQDSPHQAPSVMAQMIPIMFCFFSMGFVDTAGNCADWLRRTQELSHTATNILPALVFFCFLIFSVPAGLLMNKIGRKKTVLWSLLITLVALVLPIFGESYALMLIVCIFLGVGNTFMQVSLNPLVSNIIEPEHLASTLTFGQFVKAFTGILAPLLAAWGFSHAIPDFGLGWRIYFPIYAIVCIISYLLLARTYIQEVPVDKVSGFAKCFKLLGNGFIFLCFCGIMCHVGLDVGVNSTAPRILEDALAYGLTGAERDQVIEAATATTGFAITFYFIFRCISCFLGSILLRKIPARTFFLWSAILVLVGVGILCCGGGVGTPLIYTAIALVALGNSNLFSVIFTQCLVRNPDEGNEVSGLMIMGLFGGTIFPIAMGIASDWTASQIGAAFVLLVAAVYMLFFTTKVRNINTAG